MTICRSQTTAAQRATLTGHAAAGPPRASSKLAAARASPPQLATRSFSAPLPKQLPFHAAARPVPAQKGLFIPASVRRSIAAAATPGDVQVVSIGEGLFDCLADQLGKPRAEVESWSPFPGGAPTNVASALAKLGINVALFTALGKDEMGDTLAALLADAGVDLRGLLRVEQPTRDVYVERAVNGDRTFAGFGGPLDSYADCFIDESQLPMELVANADILISGTLGLAYPVTTKALYAVVDKAKESGTLVLIDANWRPMFFHDPDNAKPIIEEFVQKADVVKITDEETEWLFGIKGSEAVQCPDKVLEKLPNAKGVLVTAGENGAAFCVKTTGKSTSQAFLPAADIDVVDTTGAGDAFTAGFTTFMLKAGGWDKLVADSDEMLKALKYAVSTGGLTCTGKGAIAAQPSLEEVEAFAAKL